MTLVECVPNFSEGRRPGVIAAIRDAIASVDGASVLDVSSDPSHNRTVLTFVAPVHCAVAAAFAGIARARDLIDLTIHRGAHPRIGATDVCPFIPIEAVSLDDCVVLARALGERVGTELEIPVYLYERAATRPGRVNLADIRRGEFEGARDAIGRDPNRRPDFGPARIHPTAGATAIGARPVLVAYNVYLGPASNLAVAREVAKAVRASNGGLPCVKALALEVDGQSQLSMNLTDIETTPVWRAFDAVKFEAERRGVSPTWSEIVGLVPERALTDTAVHHLKLRKFSGAMVLEQGIRRAMEGRDTIGGFLESVASNAPAPGGGSVTALAGALAAALARMVAALTFGRAKYASVDGAMRQLATEAAALGLRLSQLVDEDTDAFRLVGAAQRLPADNAAQAGAREAAIQGALLRATEVPLETARACATVAALAATCAKSGNRNAVSDAGVAALLAEAACKGAAYNVRFNVMRMTDRALGQPLADEATRLMHACASSSIDAQSAVEQALGS